MDLKQRIVVGMGILLGCLFITLAALVAGGGIALWQWLGG